MEKTKLSDPISHLPEEIRHHIFSFVPTLDAMRMGEVSYAWRNDWINLSSLHFGYDFWIISRDSLKNKVGDHQDHTSNYSKKRKQNDKTFLSLRHAQFLDRFLLVLKTQKRDKPLKLSIYLPCHFGHDTNSVFMDLAFNAGYELQGLSDYYYDYNRKHGSAKRYCLFNLPGYLSASSKFLTELNLSGSLWGKMLKFVSKEGMSTQSHFQFQFLNLKKLCIGDVCLNQQMVDMLVGSCSNTALEDLMFARCRGEIFLQLSGFSKLRVLHIEGPQIRVSSHVASNSLQHLRLSDCDMFALKIDTPDLVFFSYEMIRKRNFIPIFLEIPIDPLRTSLRLSPHYYDDRWHSKVVDFLAKFSHFQRSLKIFWDADKTLIIPQELRESTSPPLWRVQHLHIEQLFEAAVLPLPKSDIHDYLDTALWLSPHPKSVSLSASTEFSNKGSWCITVELEYKEENHEIYGWGCGCYSQPIKCWRHSMKDFRIQNQNGHEDVVAIVTKFFDNAQVRIRK